MYEAFRLMLTVLALLVSWELFLQALKATFTLCHWVAEWHRDQE